MESSFQILVLGKLFAIFTVLLVLLRFHAPLWITIFAGAVTTALLGGISPAIWPKILVEVLQQPDFLLLSCMIFLILVLSGVQEAAGQSHNLVEGLEGYILNPRIRLVLFPALVGLLPMPGGALFSCPMIRDAARNMNLGNRQKALINYWFRHIWELAWPLYPGYALACTLLGIPLGSLAMFTFPTTIIIFSVGWLFLLRDPDKSLLETPALNTDAAAETHSRQPLGSVLLNGLPIAVTLAAAAVLGLVFDRLLPSLPGQAVFCFSLTLAIATALFQGRGRMSKPLARIALNRNTARIVLLLFSIYVFKDTILKGGIITEISSFGESPLAVCLTFVFLPFISGLLTGILVGIVGLSLPILIGILAHSSLQEYAVPLMVLALVSGHCGQLLSPLHVCLVVTGDFFSIKLPDMLRSLLLPAVVVFCCGLLWVFTLFLMGAKLPV